MCCMQLPFGNAGVVKILIYATINATDTNVAERYKCIYLYVYLSVAAVHTMLKY